ncbi:hypothetical protein BASA82_000003 [Batrachochytrium salamandrivorans]|nr:hypothetical protein BASA82_000003 [Batrachochytrium salamandrivorans]
MSASGVRAEALQARIDLLGGDIRDATLKVFDCGDKVTNLGTTITNLLISGGQQALVDELRAERIKAEAQQEKAEEQQAKLEAERTEAKAELAKLEGAGTKQRQTRGFSKEQAAHLEGSLYGVLNAGVVCGVAFFIQPNRALTVKHNIPGCCVGSSLQLVREHVTVKVHVVSFDEKYDYAVLVPDDPNFTSLYLTIAAVPPLYENPECTLLTWFVGMGNELQDLNFAASFTMHHEVRLLKMSPHRVVFNAFTFDGDSGGALILSETFQSLPNNSRVPWCWSKVIKAAQLSSVEQQLADLKADKDKQLADKDKQVAGLEKDKDDLRTSFAVLKAEQLAFQSKSEAVNAMRPMVECYAQLLFPGLPTTTDQVAKLVKLCLNNGQLSPDASQVLMTLEGRQNAGVLKDMKDFYHELSKSAHHPALVTSGFTCGGPMPLRAAAGVVLFTAQKELLSRGGAHARFANLLVNYCDEQGTVQKSSRAGPLFKFTRFTTPSPFVRRAGKTSYSPLPYGCTVRRLCTSLQQKQASHAFPEKMERGATLQQFQSMTGAEDEFAISFLEAANWSLDTAVDLWFGGNGPPAAPAPAPRPAEKVDTGYYSVDEDEDDEGEEMIQNTDEDEAVIRSLMESAQDDEGGGPMSISAVEARLKQLATTGDSQLLQQQQPPQQPSMFAPPRWLMFPGGFEEARLKAKQAGKWLLVNIQEEREFQSLVLNRDLWSDDVCQSLVKENFLFWQTQRSSSEAQRFITLYNPAGPFPVCVVIDPRTGEQVITLKLKRQDSDLRQAFMEQITTFCDARGMPTTSTPVPKQVPSPVAPPPSSAVLSSSTASSAVGAPPSPVPLAAARTLGGESAPPVAVSSTVVLESEPALGDANSTAICFKFPNNKRVTRRFSKTAKIGELFVYIQQCQQEHCQGQRFDLVAAGPPSVALTEVEATLLDKNLCGSVIMVRLRD